MKTFEIVKRLRANSSAVEIDPQFKARLKTKLTSKRNFWKLGNPLFAGGLIFIALTSIFLLLALVLMGNSTRNTQQLEQILQKAYASSPGFGLKDAIPYTGTDNNSIIYLGINTLDGPAFNQCPAVEFNSAYEGDWEIYRQGAQNLRITQKSDDGTVNKFKVSNPAQAVVYSGGDYAVSASHLEDINNEYGVVNSYDIPYLESQNNDISSSSAKEWAKDLDFKLAGETTLNSRKVYVVEGKLSQDWCGLAYKDVLINLFTYRLGEKKTNIITNIYIDAETNEIVRKEYYLAAKNPGNLLSSSDYTYKKFNSDNSVFQFDLPTEVIKYTGESQTSQVDALTLIKTKNIPLLLPAKGKSVITGLQNNTVPTTNWHPIQSFYLDAKFYSPAPLSKHQSDQMQILNYIFTDLLASTRGLVEANVSIDNQYTFSYKVYSNDGFETNKKHVMDDLTVLSETQVVINGEPVKVKEYSDNGNVIRTIQIITYDGYTYVLGSKFNIDTSDYKNYGFEDSYTTISPPKIPNLVM